MDYTTHGAMTPEDRADHDQLYDTGRHPGCPGHGEDGGTVYCPAVADCPDEDAARGWPR